MRAYLLGGDAAGSSQTVAADYRFRGARRIRVWPRTSGAGLGPAGAWNLLWRAGVVPRDPAGLTGPGVGDGLFVCAAGPLRDEARSLVTSWLSGGGTVVASGAWGGWGSLLGAEEVVVDTAPGPYDALAYLLPGEAPQIVAPPGWSFLRMPRAGGDLKAIGDLARVHGERQSPNRALVTRIPDAPAVLRRGGLVYLNGDPLSALQAWLQGQEDLTPWLAWRHRLFWLDELVVWLAGLLERLGAVPAEKDRSGVPGLGRTTVVLRHDLDASRDTAYLDLETQLGIPGVHAVLRDRNRRFWLERLNGRSRHEVAFHYNTLASSWLERRLDGLRGQERAPRPRRHAVAGRGLLHQVRWARSNGIGIETLHRHGAFLIYPEWVDALHEVFEAEPAVRGASSLFRGQVLRWGVDRVDGMRGTLGQFPDPSFPFWLPCRLAHAALGGRLLRGWETTSVMEIEPELLAQMLDHPLPGLPQRVLVLNYHPAHAGRPTFARDGSLTAFRRSLEVLKAHGAQARTLREVFQACDDALAATR